VGRALIPFAVFQRVSNWESMSAGSDQSVSRKVAEEALARLSPHRTHESNWFKALLCALGFDRWYHPELAGLVLEEGIRSCRWCSALRFRDDYR